MDEEARDERDAALDADAGTSAVHGRSGQPGSSSSDSSDAGSSSAEGQRDLTIRADGDRLSIGDSDLRAVRDAVAALGAHGSAQLAALSLTEVSALLDGIVDLDGALESLRARTVVRLEDAIKEDCLRREESPQRAARIARSEASRALQSSRSVAGRTLATSRRLVSSMPGLLGALSEARVPAQSVHKVGAVLAPATPEQREEVDAVLTADLERLEGCGTQEWGDEAARILHSLDPEGAAERHRTALRGRHVSVRRTEHGMARISAVIPGIDGARIRKGLSVAAESARAQGDRRGHQQIMADLLADALIGRGDGIDPTTLDVGVVITDRSLLAPAHADAALVEGFGSVPYDHVREQMLRAAQSEDDTELALVMRILYADLDDGQLVGVESRARAFPPALVRFLTLAHQTCRAPYCDAPIRQMDHIVPASQGGSTSLDNGNGLCAADNQKESAGETVRVVRDENGVRRTVRWTTRHGRSVTRGAVNLDPLGTYRRRRAKEAQALGAVAGAGERVPERPTEPAPGASAATAATGDVGTLSLARADLCLRLTDLPSPHPSRRSRNHPGDWIALRGSRGR
jgi:5-methylcytosine-specific restriction endonuclease McrA